MQRLASIYSIKYPSLFTPGIQLVLIPERQRQKSWQNASVAYRPVDDCAVFAVD